MTRIKITALILALFVVLTGCAGGGTRSTSPDTPMCAAAKSNYQMCYGNCLMVTPGGFLQAAGQCGYTCSSQQQQMNLMCAR